MSAVRHVDAAPGPGAADGSSFSFADDLPNGPFGEEGAGSGITIAFDTYNNGGGEAPAIDLKFGGTVLQQVLTNPYTSGAFYDVDIRLDPDGTLDLTYNGTAIFTDVATGYTPIAGGRFGFGARTGGLNQANYIDNLVISTATPEPSTVAMLLGLAGVGLMGYWRRRNAGR